jgi:hypothetical protein
MKQILPENLQYPDNPGDSNPYGRRKILAVDRGGHSVLKFNCVGDPK